nr:MAG TPA: hypothetical protein [Caudoviricetes sp.]
MLVSGSDFYCGNSSSAPCQLALKSQIPSQYIHPSTKQCNYSVDLSGYAKSSELNSLKTSVSNGKQLVANAITDKGVATSSSESFATMANNINSISSTDAIGAIYLQTLSDEISLYYSSKDYYRDSENYVYTSAPTLYRTSYNFQYTLTNYNAEDSSSLDMRNYLFYKCSYNNNAYGLDMFKIVYYYIRSSQSWSVKMYHRYDGTERNPCPLVFSGGDKDETIGTITHNSTIHDAANHRIYSTFTINLTDNGYSFAPAGQPRVSTATFSTWVTNAFTYIISGTRYYFPL